MYKNYTRVGEHSSHILHNSLTLRQRRREAAGVLCTPFSSGQASIA